LSEITFSKDASEETTMYCSTPTAVREPPFSSAPNRLMIQSNVFKSAYERNSSERKNFREEM
jgi:hypothetical protein